MLIALQKVSKSYRTAEGPLEVLREVDLGLEVGRTLAMTGESGSGKSTLLHLAAGLDHPDSGRIEIAGQDISQLNDAGRAALRRGVVGLGVSTVQPDPFT